MTETPLRKREDALASRDLSLDLARVACVLLVVAVHLLFTGVFRDADDIRLERTAELQPWFAAISWLLEIMPLFFVVGGFATAAGLASAARRGESGADFVRSRLLRLARPSLPLFLFLAAGLAAATLLGVDPVLFSGVAIGVGSPLWFLAAYMIVQALGPAMMRLHRARPRTTLAVLLVLIGAVDTARMLAGEPLLGLPNVFFVWLLVQQLGFWMFDGWFARRAWWQLLLLVVGGYGLLLALVPLAGYSWNMLSNQYPPTLPLAVLGVVQAASLTLLRRPLTALMRLKAAQGVVLIAGTRLMTIYLWHLPVIIALVGVQLLLPFPMSEPGSAGWWAERLPAYLLVLGAVWLLSLWLVRFERPAPGDRGTGASPGVVAAAVVAFTAPPFLVMVLGLDLWLAAAGLAGTALALLLARPARAGAS